MISLFGATGSILGEIHEVFSYFVIGATAFAGLWALLAHWIIILRHKTLWWSTIVAHAFVGVQVILGAIQLVSEDVETDGFHIFYGFIALASVGIIFSYKSQLKEKKYLLFGLGGLFLMGLSIRALLLAG